MGAVILTEFLPKSCPQLAFFDLNRASLQAVHSPLWEIYCTLTERNARTVQQLNTFENVWLEKERS